jgi:hypothetical protein
MHRPLVLRIVLAICACIILPLLALLNRNKPTP